MTEIRKQLQAALTGTYTIERELGGGGMSRVFVATEESLQRKVVIKVLPHELAGGVNIDRFRREITVVAQLQHPHIVPVLAAGEMEGLPYFSMPFVEGQSLRARLVNGELPLADVLWILRDVGKALSYAHRHGVVHRDIKPDNILLNDDAAVVTDFGVAKAISASARDGTMTSLGVALGTPAYMSPEQAAAAPNVDARSDIYAMGVVAYEMIAGRTPFAGRSPQQMLAAHAVETPEPIAKLRPTVSPALASLVMRCLEKSPADRPQTVDAVLQELNAIATPSGGTMPTSATRVTRAPLRIPGWAALLGVLAVLGAGGAWLGLKASGPRLDAQVIAIFPFRVTSSDPQLEYLREAMADLLSMKLAGDSGMRATDLRAVIAEWKRSGGGDLSLEQEKTIAQKLGAGQVITGEVVGTRTNVVINASFAPVGAGAVIRRTVQGSPDSISALVDVLAAQLLSLRAGEGEDRLAMLTRTPLAALRAYLDGLRSYRRGDYEASRQAYMRALAADPGFLLAMLGLSRADGWSGNPARRDSLRRIIWQRRDELSRVDRLLLAAEAGERTPGFTPYALRLAAAERATQAAWDNPEAWYQLADLYLHYGAMLGRETPLNRALAGFNRALALDSTFRPAVEHLPQLYQALGDTAGRRRAVAHFLTLDSTSGRATAARWLDAVARNDRAALSRLRFKNDNDGIVPALIGAANTGIGVPYIDSIYQTWQAELLLPTERRGFVSFSRVNTANMGRPAALSRDLSLIAEDTTFPDQRPLYALAWDADSADGNRGARAIRARWRSPVTRQRLNRRVQELTGLALWSLEQGKESDMRDAHAQLREAAAMPDSVPGQAQAAVAVLIVDAWLADRGSRPDAAAALSRLDSALGIVAAPVQMTALGNVIAARLWERRGDQTRALQTLRRREWFLSTSPFFLSTVLREEGRLAEATGDREGAIRAYEHYLAMRYKPEPTWQADRDRVQAAVERLKRELATR